MNNLEITLRITSYIILESSRVLQINHVISTTFYVRRKAEIASKLLWTTPTVKMKYCIQVFFLKKDMTTTTLRSIILFILKISMKESIPNSYI